MKRSRICSMAAALAIALLTVSVHAEAPASSSEAKREAADRFDRGLRLFNEGDNAGALVEFHRAYELTRDPLILFNVGLVYAEMKRPIDAVDALDQLLSSSAPLPAPRRAEAARVRAEQAASIAFLEIVTSTAATIEVDGVEVAHAPLGGPLRLAAGSHVVGAIAAGHEPLRKTIDIAGGERRKLEFSLIPLQEALGHVAIHSDLPAADILIDGQVVGRTPATSTFKVSPGVHRVELQRAGYRVPGRQVMIDEGATAEVSFGAEIDAAELQRNGGGLLVEVSEPGASISIDGIITEATAGETRLPPGVHHLSILRSGFENQERDVSVTVGVSTTVKIVLTPTAETRDAFVARVSVRRIWGWSVTGVGIATLAGGVVVVANGHNELNAANRGLADTLVRATRFSGDPMCDPGLGQDSVACVDAANQRVSSAQSHILYGYITAGVGAAAAIAGAVVLLTGDDPARYDRPPGKVRIAAVSGWSAASGGGLSLSGLF